MADVRHRAKPSDSQLPNRPPAHRWQRGYLFPIWCDQCRRVHDIEVYDLPGRQWLWEPERLLIERWGNA
jgi:hypothetical protein